MKPCKQTCCVLAAGIFGEAWGEWNTQLTQLRVKEHVCLPRARNQIRHLCFTTITMNQNLVLVHNLLTCIVNWVLSVCTGTENSTHLLLTQWSHSVTCLAALPLLCVPGWYAGALQCCVSWHMNSTISHIRPIPYFSSTLQFPTVTWIPHVLH